MLYKKAKYEVQKAIRGAKIEYRRKLENQFLASNTRAVWKGMQTLTGYKKKCSTTSCNDPQFPDNLDEFYGRFDRQNTTTATASPPDPATPLPPPFIVEESAVKKLFRKQNSKNAVGPDNVSTSVLKHSADQLSPCFTDINTSLQLSKVPHCFKTSNIIPVPKKPKVTSMNDYRPVALTSVVMKVFERLVLKHLKSVTSRRLDPLQFA